MAHDRETTSMLDEKIFMGRHNDIENIMDKIQKQANCSSGPPLVISVAGVGGIGKTTLAQKIYNHEKIVSNVFEEKLWVCVADVFCENTVTKQVLAEVKRINANDVISLQTVKQEIAELLASKKFLLILDDVWIEDEKNESKVKNRETWKKFFCTFDQCKGGSSIVVTTRLPSVVNMIGDCFKVDLKGLSREESKSLFMSHAFPGWVSGDTHNKELEVKGEEIVKKLEGLPLALKFVGMHLTDNRSVEYWEEVLKHIILAAGNVLSVLKLSYDHLPPHLKPCFGYCGLFPKGCKFYEDDVTQLIHMWIAQGFVVDGENEAGRSLEVIGRVYFDDLCSRSFFQQSESWYVMHDLINDLALSVSNEECAQLLNESSAIRKTFTCRHVSVSSTNLSVLSTIPSRDKLRTLFIFNTSRQDTCSLVDDKILASFRGVRVLNLASCCKKKFPKTIKGMIHLRYLSSPATSMLLPKTCSKLYNLQVLCMMDHRRYFYKCSDLDNRGPKYMSSLSNLRHVYYLKRNDLIKLMLSGHFTCKIPQFHGDWVFIVNPKIGNKLKYIHSEIGLQGRLEICELENANKDDALKINISQSAHMKELKLSWLSSTRSSHHNANLVLEALLPPSNLPVLTVDGYPGIKYPSWLENNHLTNVRKLILTKCCKLRELPSLGHLPMLEDLTIGGLNKVERIPSEFCGKNGVMGFQSLRCLVLENMQNLVEWSVPEYHPLFPKLENIYIEGCPKLSTIPNIHTDTSECKYMVKAEKFDKVFVLGVASSESESCYELYHSLLKKQGKVGVLIWKVTYGSGLKYASAHLLDEVEKCKLEFLDFHSHPEAVKDFYLINLYGPLPKDGFTKLSSLERLTIEMSTEYLSFGGHEEEHNDVDFLPKSLKSLTIRDCRARRNFLSRCFRSLSALVQLEITNLALLEMEPINLQCLTSLAELRIKVRTSLMIIKQFEIPTCLTTLEISECHKLSLTVLTRDSGSQVNSPHANLLFPFLKYLKWDLRPDFRYTNPEGENEERDIQHSSMDTVEIIGSSDKQITGSFSGFLQCFSSLSVLKISSLNLSCDLAEILDLKHFIGLKVLHVTNCTGLRELINFHFLTLLEDLDIYNCPDLFIRSFELDDIRSLNLMIRCRLPEAYLPMVRNRIHASEGHIGEDTNEVQESEHEDEASNRNCGRLQDAEQMREFDESEPIKNFEFKREKDQAISESLKDPNIGSNDGESSLAWYHEYIPSDNDEDEDER